MAAYFKREILAAASAAGPHVTEIVVDMLPVTFVDATGIYTTQEVASELERRGVTLAAAGRQTEWRVWAESRKFSANVTQSIPDPEKATNH